MSIDELREENKRLRDEVEHYRSQRIACIRCGDGNTALYCLNCAAALSRLRPVLREMAATPGIKRGER